MGYGDTEIGFLDQGEVPASVDPQPPHEGIPLRGVAHAILESGVEDQIARLYRDGTESGSAVVTISIVDGDESEVTKLLYASGALNVNAYRDDTGWLT
jgi:hypothetical protein